MDRPVIFIMGAPRSGTTWLQKLLSEHKHVATPLYVEDEKAFPYELETFGYVEALENKWQVTEKANEKFKRKRDLPYLLGSDYIEEICGKLVNDVYGKLINNNPEAIVIIDKYPYNFKYVGLIKKYIPQAKFIHVIRDGRNMILSQRNTARMKIGIGSENIVYVANKWVNCVQNAQKVKEKVKPDQYFECKYEDLKGEGGTVILTNLFKFCGLEANEEMVNHILEINSLKKRKLSWGNKEIRDKNAELINVLTTMEKLKVHKIAGKELMNQGYIKSNSWWSNNDISRLFYPILLKLNTYYNYVSFAIRKLFQIKVKMIE